MARLTAPPTQEQIHYYKPTHIIYQRNGIWHIKQRPPKRAPKK